MWFKKHVSKVIARWPVYLTQQTNVDGILETLLDKTYDVDDVGDGAENIDELTHNWIDDPLDNQSHPITDIKHYMKSFRVNRNAQFLLENKCSELILIIIKHLEWYKI